MNEYFLINDFSELASEKLDKVQIIGRIINVKKLKHQIFYIVSEPGMSINTIQCVDKQTRNINKYSIVRIFGCVIDKNKNIVKSCTISNFEIEIDNIEIIDASINKLPISTVDDIGLFADEKNNNTHNQKILLKSRLDNRVIDLRNEKNKFIFSLSALVCKSARKFFDDNNFMEIHTPKIISSASENGSSVFKLNYFNKDAYLAQSPQLYKQMAILSDFRRVYEIGPVFRAENSNTHRHLTEFIGIDMEMSIVDDYHEVMHMLIKLFMHIFQEIETVMGQQILDFWGVSENIIVLPKNINEVPILTFSECMKLIDLPENELSDLTTSNEKKLGDVVKKIYGYDFFVIDKFPANVRPFYTMKDAIDGNYSNSYDFFIRGEEVLSGAQRINNYESLVQACNADASQIKTYIESFKYGSYKHGGGGIGLERFVMLYTGIKNIRNTSMFPRDPLRLNP